MSADSMKTKTAIKESRKESSTLPFSGSSRPLYSTTRKIAEMHITKKLNDRMYPISNTQMKNTRRVDIIVSEESSSGNGRMIFRNDATSPCWRKSETQVSARKAIVIQFQIGTLIKKWTFSGSL